MRDGTCASTTSSSVLVDNVHQVPARTANFHYARMRCAEATAARLSVSRGELADAAAVRDSYYLLAAAHRSAARRCEKRAQRQLAWSDFKARPFVQIGIMAGDRARSARRKASRLVRTIRRAVSL
ncbi:hypothetical protein [Streptomyces cylindrosporus]|uniref:Uncharacterized protein n=1 Tax=Streptomyces cylindrosporus TaxID=2927583 RepID=A0ABS9YPH9_9ACTN|nr:hypothetical protein [Streptomyces cylindrosporus]MCI3279122.1 hypothetical protein [Streptomyces cylindrosporus]